MENRVFKDPILQAVYGAVPRSANAVPIGNLGLHSIFSAQMTSPPLDVDDPSNTVPMYAGVHDNFDPEKWLRAVVNSVYRCEQKVPNVSDKEKALLDYSTWYNLFDYYWSEVEKGNFTRKVCSVDAPDGRIEKGGRIGLQMLLIASKADVVAMNRDYYPTQPFEYGYNLYFNVLIRHLQTLPAENSFTEYPAERAENIKKFVCQPAVIAEIKKIIERIRSSGDKQVEFDEERLIEKAKSAVITTAYGMGRMGFGGMVLRNGFFLNIDHLRDCNENRSAAELVYGAHEMVHFLLRTTAANFGFESPTSNLPFGYERTASAFNLPMESGREIQDVLCDGIKINWTNSYPVVGVRFMERAFTNERTIIRKGDIERCYVIEYSHTNLGFTGAIIDDDLI